MAMLLARIFGLVALTTADARKAAAPTSLLTAPAPAPSVRRTVPGQYANLVTTRMGGLTPEEIALLMSMLDDNGDGELTCAHRNPHPERSTAFSVR